MMFALFLYLIGFRVHRSLMDHAYAGIAVIVLVMIHLILNFRFYKNLLKGKYNGVRFCFTISNCLILSAFLTMLISSVMVMGAVFEFAPFPYSQLGRDLHTLSASWLFVLIVWHAALHLNRFWVKAETYLMKKKRFYLQCFNILQIGLFFLSFYILSRGEILPGLFLQRSVRQLFSGSMDFYVQTLLGSLCLIIAAHWTLRFLQNRIKRRY